MPVVKDMLSIGSTYPTQLVKDMLSIDISYTTFTTQQTIVHNANTLF